MKSTNLIVATFALFTSGIVAACASGDSALTGDSGIGTGGASSGIGGASNGDGPTTTGSGPTTGAGGETTTATTSTGATGVGGASTTTGGGVCVAQCKQDSDCQGSCPPVGNGENCCDSATGVCYVSNMAACPMPPPATSSGAGGSMY